QARGQCRITVLCWMQSQRMSEKKSARNTARGGSQRQARVPRCEDWALDKAFTWDMLTTTRNDHAEITRQTKANRSANGIFEERRARANRQPACSAGGRICAGSWCECGECPVQGLVEHVGTSSGLVST